VIGSGFFLKKPVAPAKAFAKLHARFPVDGGKTINRKLFFLWLDNAFAFD
jgi:hypothetical protein